MQLLTLEANPPVPFLENDELRFSNELLSGMYFPGPGFSF